MNAVLALGSAPIVRPALVSESGTAISTIAWAVGNTLAIVLAGAVIAAVVGLPIGLFISGSPRLLAVSRSVLAYPFTVALLAFTPVLGSWAFPVLACAGVVCFTERAGVAFSRIPRNLVDATTASGARGRQVVASVYLRECLPDLILGARRTVILLLGYAILAEALGLSPRVGDHQPGIGNLAMDYARPDLKIGPMLGLFVAVAALLWLLHVMFAACARRIDHRSGSTRFRPDRPAPSARKETDYESAPPRRLRDGARAGRGLLSDRL